MNRHKVLSENDRRELDNFVRYLQIVSWRRKELHEDQRTADMAACLEVYGDKYGEG